MFAQAYAHLGWYSILEQDREAAEDYITTAKSLRPEMAYWVLWHGWICYFFKDYECTAEFIDKALEMNPNLSEGKYLRGLMYYAAGESKESIHWFNLAAQDSTWSHVLGMSYILQNKMEDAKRIIRELEESDKRKLELVISYVMLGDKDKTLDILEDVYDRKNPNMPWLQFDPILQPFLKDDLRFQELVQKVGKPMSG